MSFATPARLDLGAVAARVLGLGDLGFDVAARQDTVHRPPPPPPPPPPPLLLLFLFLFFWASSKSV